MPAKLKSDYCFIVEINSVKIFLQDIREWNKVQRNAFKSGEIDKNEARKVLDRLEDFMYGMNDKINKYKHECK